MDGFRTKPTSSDAAEAGSDAPVIAVTKPAGRGYLPYAALSFALRLVGARPVSVSSVDDVDGLEIQGVLLGGGDDVFPAFLEEPPAESDRFDRARDEIELRLAEAASAADVPLLGVCRGVQVINVARGGSLYLDTRAAYEDADYPDGFLGHVFYRKQIKTDPGTLIRRTLRKKLARVNSLHRQSIRRLGDGLVVTARERNGVVQAIEDPSRRFLLGVQFHPELILYRAMHRRIFALFRETASRTTPRTLIA